jgi:hypothetical protein
VYEANVQPNNPVAAATAKTLSPDHRDAGGRYGTDPDPAPLRFGAEVKDRHWRVTERPRGLKALANDAVDMQMMRASVYR